MIEGNASRYRVVFRSVHDIQDEFRLRITDFLRSLELGNVVVRQGICGGGSWRTEWTISRLTLNLLVFVIWTAMTIIEMLLVKLISLRLGLGGDPFGGLIVGLAVLNLVLSVEVVEATLKAVGLSRSGRVVERRQPANTIPEYAATDERLK